jgi:AcrR family transcriptional regulator
MSSAETAAPALTPWGPITMETPAGRTAERILDAALARFSGQGVSATTMSQIAADVGISRVWLYRYFENRDAVMRALLGRETQRLIDEFATIDDPSAPFIDVAVDAFDHVVGSLRANDLIQGVLHNEPQVVAPFVAAGTAPLLRIAVDVVAKALRERVGMTPVEARAVGETLLRLVVSIVATNDVGVDFDDPRQRRAYARRVLPRLIGPRVA